MTQISYTKIGTNRGSPRLWIEGVKLGAANFRRGDRYSLNLTDGVLTITKTAHGARKVSGRTRGGVDIPIIDLEMTALLQGFGLEDRVRVVFAADVITVTIHHEEHAMKAREERFRNGLKNKSLSEASLFTGAGISTLAIHKALTDAGYDGEVKWVVDSELKYLQVGYTNNLAITDETCAIVGKAEEVEGGFFSSVDILSFSMPCAGFSTAGKSKHKRRAEDHDGATALFGVVSAVRNANPAVLISENVTEAQDAPAYLLLKAELVRLGYAVFERILDSTHTGSIENRKRYWFIAISIGLARGFEFLLHRPGQTSKDRTIADILEASVDPALWSDNQYLKDKAVRDARDGKGFAARQLLTGEETRCGTIGRHYNKRRSTEPFLVRDDGKERLFTPAEHARVKSVPEELVEGIAPTTAHEVLGQSIDFLQGYLSMKTVTAFFEGNPATEEIAVSSAADPEQLTLF